MNHSTLTKVSSKTNIDFKDHNVKLLSLNTLGKFVAGAALALALTSSAYAAPIFGTFGLTLGEVRITNGGINFLPEALPTGDFTVNSEPATRSGSFLNPVFNVNTLGNIGDLSNNPLDLATFFPLGAGATPRNNYITLAAMPSFQFRLTELINGQIFAGFPSPYFLIQAGPNVSATFSLRGTALELGDPESNRSNFNLIISSTFTNATIQSITDQVIANTLPTRNWSGTLTADAIPEPATMALMGASLAAIALYRRSRR